MHSGKSLIVDICYPWVHRLEQVRTSLAHRSRSYVGLTGTQKRETFRVNAALSYTASSWLT
jgi:hypothetical protein